MSLKPVGASSSPAANGSGVAAPFRGLEGFEAPSAPGFSVAILGDLHLEPPFMHDFYIARDQLVGALREKEQEGLVPRVVQLGDLGGYKFKPGSQDCFDHGRQYLGSYGLPGALVLGNHDLEGEDFETDEENLAAWQATFGQRHYWSVDVGPATFIGLSTVRFRSNPHSVHEVHVDEEQMAFFRAKLQEVGDRPVVVFTHAPILGSGLRVVQTVHVKNRCAWVNHSSNPREFIELVEAHPNIRLWFSGHFHLSHNYSDSISVVGGTAFVLTGVIGHSTNRDGFRHSRVLRGTPDGYELYTMDHDTGNLRLDLAHAWADPSPPSPLVPEDELICDPSAGWLCSQLDCSGRSEAESSLFDACPGVAWLNAGPGRMLAVQDGIIVEYDVRSMSPIGVVSLDVPDDCEVVLVDAAGAVVDGHSTDGSEAVAVEVRQGSELHQCIKRNAQGGFFQIYQANKWRLRKEKEAAEAAAAAAAAAGKQAVPATP